MFLHVDEIDLLQNMEVVVVDFEAVETREHHDTMGEEEEKNICCEEKLWQPDHQNAQITYEVKKKKGKSDPQQMQ